MKQKYYITAAIPYVNGDPHIGHALEFVQADSMARYQRLLGKKVLYLSGADENALKNVQAAEKEGITTQALCDRNAGKFQDLCLQLQTSLNIFQRSSDRKSHWAGSQKLWQLCLQNGDIYKKKYKGFYCVGCESFLTEKDLVAGQCPEHLKKPEIVEEENYFFALAKYQKQLLELIEKDELKIIPDFRKNEATSFIKRGLEDFSISRSQKRAKGWGIPVPGDKTQIIYVWFDALNVYQTGIGFGINEIEYQKWWPADTHVIGKGILRFHAIYWIAILLSAKLKLPKQIFVHGYITSLGQKMSKSLGNVIDPFAEIKKYGVDPVRYYLFSQIPAYQDGDYNDNQFQKVYQSDLANGLGNLVARVAKLCEKSGFEFECRDIPWYVSTENIPEYHQALNEFRFNDVIGIIWEKIKKLDQKVDHDKPWQKLKATDHNLKTELSSYVSEIRKIASLLQPFLPETAEKIQKQFKGPRIQSQSGLFPRLT